MAKKSRFEKALEITRFLGRVSHNLISSNTDNKEKHEIKWSEEGNERYDTQGQAKGQCKHKIKTHTSSHERAKSKGT